MRGRTVEAFLIGLAALSVPVAASADWRGIASEFDQARLSRLDEARQQGMAEAGDIGAVREAMGAPVTGGSVEGDWRCRTIKMGGMSSSMVYSWYRCRITDRGGALFFEKISGTQRMAGMLYPDAGGYVYLGASWVKGEAPHRYSGGGASVGADATPDDQVGMLFRTEGGARIEMPFPLQESTFDVIELKR